MIRLKAYQKISRALMPYLPKSITLRPCVWEGDIQKAGLPILSSAQQSGRIWFHAASVGELECLWPLVMESSAAGYEIIVTVFSPSVYPLLLQRTAQNAVPGLISAGYSPWEGYWQKALEQARPRLMVTARYEAWPELWSALAELDIPLALVSARLRSSLKWGGRCSRWLTGKIPRLIFFTHNEKDAAELQSWFPMSKNFHAGDPRWDQIEARQKKSESQPRMRQIFSDQAFWNHLPRPWGILGSVWEEDAELFSRAFQNLKMSHQPLPAVLWVAPHQVGQACEKKWETVLRDADYRLHWTQSPESLSLLSHSEPAALNAIIVNEIGILPELYPQMDYAYVGGGLGKGLHSTMEPALPGLPIAAAPKGGHLFSEVQLLLDQGQLQWVHEDGALQRWLVSEARKNHPRRSEWRNLCRSHLFSSQRVMQVLQKELLNA